MGTFLMNWKSTAAVSGATVLAGWLNWTSTPPQQTAPGAASVAARDERDARAAAAASDIEEQARRLQTRVRNELDYQDPTRNPFRFGSRTPAAGVHRAVQEPLPPYAVPGPIPELLVYTLAGVATDTVNGKTQRTAIISTPSDLLFVTGGERVGSYTVTRVDEDGVELTSADGTTHRLALTP